MTAGTPPPVRGNLIRWSNGGSRTGEFGVINEATQNGHVQVRVRLDTGDEHSFVWPSSALERIVFAPGDEVQTSNDGEAGVVASAQETNGVLWYSVRLPGGVRKVVMESGLRPAIITDAVELLRRGVVHDARSTNLRLVATRLLYAHRYDELSSLSNSRVEIKPHQVAVVHRVSTSFPHRFLLADEVGLGKTIEAALIVKELKSRGVAPRVLILAPPNIVSQWQFELKTKFNLVFSRYTKGTIDYLRANNPGDNVWTLNDNVISSSTFAAWDENRRKEIALAGWDLVIIDEAHHARRTWEGDGRYRSTNLYSLAQDLSDDSGGGASNLLFLTATPMQLDTFELYSLVELLDPTLFPDFGDFEAHRRSLAGLNATADLVRRWSSLDLPEKSRAQIDAAGWLELEPTALAERLLTEETRLGVIEQLAEKHRLSNVLIRNRKAIVGGFMPRAPIVWEVDMTDQERAAYDAATDYVRTGYARANESRNNALGFLMSVFQKLNSSSSYALKQSLKKRIEKLQLQLDGPRRVNGLDEIDTEEQPVEEALGDLLALRANEAAEDEILDLRRIVRLLDAIPVDTKAAVLQHHLDRIAAEEPDAKVLIFTQFVNTLQYLARQVPDDWQVHVFHGGMKAEEKDRSIKAFHDGRGPQVLISTEAGGEGRNFQFAHILVNYDLPWNPMKIEQRIGRLDRIGQKHPVKIINFAIRGTIEERVLDVLTRRIRVFEETVGGLDPILGDVEDDLKRLYLMAENQRQRAFGRLEDELEARITRAREAERRLADFIMDTRSFRQDEVRRLLDREGSVDKDALRYFVIAALTELGCKIDNPAPGTEPIYTIYLRNQFLNEYPQLAREGVVRRVTFDPAVATDQESVEFFAIGHELVDELLARVRKSGYDGLASYRRVRTNDVASTRGWFFVYSLGFDGVVSSRELLPVFVDANGEYKPELSSWLLDRASRMKREQDWDARLPERDEVFERAAQFANASAIERLNERLFSLTATNQERVDQERRKLERFYEYREKSAKAKFEAVQRTLERLSASEEPQVQRIVPVWVKNLENAGRVVDTLAAERERRLAELNARDQVSAQHELLSASFVEIVPDDRSAPTNIAK